MATSKEQLKQYFETGDTPSEGQFGELIDSYRHIDTGEVISTVDDADDSTTLTITDGSTVIVPKSNFYDNRYKRQYSETIMVEGDADKYYQVVIKGGNQNRIRELNIHRGFNDPAPDTWNTPTHKGALTAEFRLNAGNWGGAQYDWMLLDFREVYSNMLADAGRTPYNRAFYVMLRGGGATYLIDSDDVLDIQIAYSTADIVFPSSNPTYVVYGKEPLNEVNTQNLSGHQLVLKRDVGDLLNIDAANIASIEPNTYASERRGIVKFRHIPTGGNTYFHIKTPMRVDSHSHMYHFSAEGYFYGAGEIIDIVWVGYCYNAGNNIIRTQSNVSRADLARVTAGQYVGTDNHVYLWLKGYSSYYTTFRINTIRVGSGPLFEEGDLEVIVSDQAQL
ncbi:hypothetical protein [uncultured Dokdonia sp.]|uniref:hypothetical protein n=1 Tax=uncultured Dokdonia sp. TaxID=575653 RepID=UPI00260AA4A9|nr:hypothetical protein [uncultured Dokdonia sp.]